MSRARRASRRPIFSRPADCTLRSRADSGAGAFSSSLPSGEDPAAPWLEASGWCGFDSLPHPISVVPLSHRACTRCMHDANRPTAEVCRASTLAARGLHRSPCVDALSRSASSSGALHTARFRDVRLGVRLLFRTSAALNLAHRLLRDKAPAGMLRPGAG